MFSFDQWTPVLLIYLELVLISLIFKSCMAFFFLLFDFSMLVVCCLLSSYLQFYFLKSSDLFFFSFTKFENFY